MLFWITLLFSLNAFAWQANPAEVRPSVVTAVSRKQVSGEMVYNLQIDRTRTYYLHGVGVVHNASSKRSSAEIVKKILGKLRYLDENDPFRGSGIEGLRRMLERDPWGEARSRLWEALDRALTGPSGLPDMEAIKAFRSMRSAKEVEHTINRVIDKISDPEIAWHWIELLR